MQKTIAKIAKRFLTGSVLMAAVVLAPKDGCDQLGRIGPSRGLADFDGPAELEPLGRPDGVVLDVTPIIKPAEF